MINKTLGETPLQALEDLRTEKSFPSDLPMTYAGRLDPMAEGKLLILTGEDCKRRERFDGLDKEYVFEILFGFESDTGDILGIPSVFFGEKSPLREALQDVADSVRGKINLPYPLYSSKKVLGKQLFQHAHDKSISESQIPISESRVYKIKCLEISNISGSDVLRGVIDKIGRLNAPFSPDKVGSDFRKKEILERWDSIGKKIGVRDFSVARFKAVVSSGTYIRSLAPSLAKKIGNHGLAFSIKRTVIGRYLDIGGHGFWFKKM